MRRVRWVFDLMVQKIKDPTALLKDAVRVSGGMRLVEDGQSRDKVHILVDNLRVNYWKALRGLSKKTREVILEEMFPMNDEAENDRLEFKRCINPSRSVGGLVESSSVVG